MSVRMMARVWEHSRHAGTDLLMMLAIADFADDDGRAYPSVPTLAKKCRVVDRHANRILITLRDSGELEIRQNDGPRGTNRYRILLQGMTHMSPLTPASPLTPMSPTPDAGVLKPLTPASDEPSLNHQEPPVIAKARGRVKSERQTFKVWYEATKARNPEIWEKDDPTLKYLEQVGISYELMVVHWHVFKSKHLDSRKVQADWPATFRNSVKGNYGRLWWRTPEGSWKLTTAGKQAAIEHGLDENMTSSSSSSSSARDWTASAA